MSTSASAISDLAGMLRIRVFGTVTVERDGVPLKDLRHRNADQLLAYLIIHGRPVQRTVIAETFWPHSSSMDSLRQAIHSLRKGLGEDAWRLQSSEGGLSVDTTGAEVDLRRFEDALTSGDPDRLEEAVQLAMSSLVEGCDDEWIVNIRREKADRLTSALQSVASTSAAEGNHARAIAALWHLLTLRPESEQVWHDLMEAQMAAGERVAAIELYEQYRDRLMHRHRLEPSPRMKRLYHLLREPDAAELEANWQEKAFDPAGGPVPLGSHFYVERGVDNVMGEALANGLSIVRLQGARHTGKSSILARGLQRARLQGAQTFVTEIARLNESDLETMDSLCRALAAMVAGQMEMDVDPFARWTPSLGAGVNLERFVLRSLLSSTTAQVVWAIDDVDRLFDMPYADEFFALLRSWHGRRAMDPTLPWGRFTLALVFATEAHLYLRDLNHSPFNVGLRIPVDDLTAEQVEDLVDRYRFSIETERELVHFTRLVGGCPYLVQRALQEMVSRSWTVSDLELHAAEEDGPFADLLRDLEQHLTQDPDLHAAMKEVLAGRPCADNPFTRLKSAGVLRGNAESPALRCGIFAEYLGERL